LSNGVQNFFCEWPIHLIYPKNASEEMISVTL